MGESIIQTAFGLFVSSSFALCKPSVSTAAISSVFSRSTFSVPSLSFRCIMSTLSKVFFGNPRKPLGILGFDGQNVMTYDWDRFMDFADRHLQIWENFVYCELWNKTQSIRPQPTAELIPNHQFPEPLPPYHSAL